MNKQIAIAAGVVFCFGSWLGIAYVTAQPNADKATADNVRHISTPIFGCKSRDSADRISELLGQHQKTEAVRFVQAGIDNGECAELIKGEAVAVEQSGIGMMKVRRPGETVAYWTISEAVGP